MKLFAVVDRAGNLRKTNRAKHHSFMIYDTEGKARNNARADGDSVVPLELDLTREPLFIRQLTVQPQ